MDISRLGSVQQTQQTQGVSSARELINTGRSGPARPQRPTVGGQDLTKVGRLDNMFKNIGQASESTIMCAW